MGDAPHERHHTEPDSPPRRVAPRARTPRCGGLMRWPLVFRPTLEQRERELRAYADSFCAERDNAEAREAAIAARYDGLLEKFTALRVAGAVPEPKPTITGLVATVAAQQDELRDLIHERAGGDMKRLGLMLAQLRRDRADKLDEDEIRRRIETGVQTDGVPA